MNNSKEFNASTVEEAVSKAAQTLSVSEAELSYEVLDSGSEGFLGIGARDARISVSIETIEDSTHSQPLDTDDDQDFDPASVTTSASSPDREEAPSSEDDLEFVSESSPAPDELVEEVREYVTSFVEAMGLGARVDAYDTEEYIAVDITSDHTALIIGQKGETIDAIQHLVNSAVYRDREFIKRIILDSEGYRQRRIEAIQGMAHRTARKSVREQRNIKMPPMSSSERRVVHVYLKDNPEVNTFSEGVGSERRVTVAPS